EGTLDHRLALRLARHIGGEDRGLAALDGDRLGRLLGVLGLGVHAENARALAGKEDGGGLAVAETRAPRARAGGDGGLASKAVAHLSALEGAVDADVDEIRPARSEPAVDARADVGGLSPPA